MSQRIDLSSVLDDPAHRLLTVLRADSHLGRGAAPPASPGGSVVRMRGSLVGTMLLGAVLVGSGGVAAAFTGNPLAGMSGLQDTVIAVAAADDARPLIRSEVGVVVHERVGELREMLAAGDMAQAEQHLAELPEMLGALSEGERAMIADEISREPASIQVAMTDAMTEADSPAPPEVPAPVPPPLSTSDPVPAETPPPASTGPAAGASPTGTSSSNPSTSAPTTSSPTQTPGTPPPSATQTSTPPTSAGSPSPTPSEAAGVSPTPTLNSPEAVASGPS